MKLKADLFPYPMLHRDLDDYLNNEDFSVVITPEILSQDKVVIRAEFSLHNEDLLRAILAGDVVYALHIEGVSSNYREFITSDGPFISHTIDMKNLRKKFEVNGMLIAAKEITNFHSSQFNPDFYEGYVIETLEKGDILAFQDTEEISLEFNQMAPVSARSMVRVGSTKKEYMELELQDQVIRVKVPEPLYKVYQQSSHYSVNQRNMFVIGIIMPALIAALEAIKSGDHEDQDWVEALYHLLEKHHLMPNDVENIQSVEVAQRLLNLPLDSLPRLIEEVLND